MPQIGLSGIQSGATVPTILAAVVGNGVADDTAAIQAALNTAHANGGGRVFVPFRSAGICLISTGGVPLVIYSNTKLEAEFGVVYRQAAGANCNMIVNAAVATTAAGGVDGTVGAGATDVTSALFTAGRIGQSFTLWGAGVAGAAVSGTVVSAGHGTLGVASTLAVTNGYVAVGPRDTDIEITGGTWDAQSSSNVANVNCFFSRWRRCDRLKISGARFINGVVGGNSCYAMSLGDLTDLVVDDIDLNVARDGVHIEGCVQGFEITNIRGTTGDDFIAILSGNYAIYQEVLGPVTDGIVDNVLLINAKSGIGVVGNGSLFPIDRVTVSNVTGTVTSTGVGVRIVDDVVMTGNTYVNQLTLRNIDIASPGNTGDIIRLAATSLTDLVIDGLVHNEVGSVLIHQYASTTTAHLTVRGLVSLIGPTGNIIKNDGTIGDLTLDTIDILFGNGGKLILFAATAAACRVTLNNFHCVGNAAGRGTILQQANGAGAISLAIANGFAKSLAQITVSGGALTVLLNSVEFDTFGNGSFTTNNAAATLVIYAAAVRQISDGGIVLQAGSTLRVNGQSYRVNLTFVTNPVDGDMLYNISAVPACGVGTVVYNEAANKWKNIYSGVTT